MFKQFSQSLQFINLFFLGIFSLLVTSFTLHANTGISLGYPGYGGNACPQGTASVTLSPDGTALTLIFDEFITQAGGGTGKTLDRKSCNLSIPVHVPNGFSISVIGVDYRGFNALPTNAWSRFSVEYFFAGSQGPSYTKIFRGPLNQNYLINNDLEMGSMVWSPCGESVNLRVNSNMMLSNNNSYYDAMSTVDSADFKAGMVYHLKIRSCF